MIAIFTQYERTLQNFTFHPKELFVRVRDIRDVSGREFQGIIMFDSIIDDDKHEAYKYLINKQPELLNKR